MDADFISTKLLLEELRRMGYTEVWLGNVPNPHWMHGSINGIVAAPKVRDYFGRPRLWDLNEVFGKNYCANGLSNADQTLRSGVRGMIPGHFVLNDGEWEVDRNDPNSTVEGS